MRAIVEEVEATLPVGAWPIWTGSNHDVSRLATRWAGGDPAKVRCALLILLTLRGTPFLYQGDEIGLTDGPIEQSDLRDRVGIRFWPYYKGRDAERTPMPWSAGPGGGFTRAGVRTWLPMADPAQCNVADQDGDPDSVLAFTRRAIARRAGSDDLALGSYRSLPSPAGTWAFERGGGTVVALNMSDSPQRARRRRRVDRPGHRPGAGGSRACGPDSRWRPGAGSSSRRDTPAVPALRHAGPGSCRPAAGHRRPVGRRRAPGGVLHHRALPRQGDGDRGAVRPAGARVRRPRSDGGQPRPGGRVAAGAARGEGGPPGDLPGPLTRAIRRALRHPARVPRRRDRRRHHVRRCVPPRPTAPAPPPGRGLHRGVAAGGDQPRHRPLRRRAPAGDDPAARTCATPP